LSKLLDISEFCKNLPEITSSKIIGTKGKFVENGLFSEVIFGPIKNYTCQCGIFHGQSKIGICNICKVEITNSGERRKRFAKIKLPVEVVNPIFHDLVLSAGGPRNKLNDLMMNEGVLYKKDNKYNVVLNQNDIPQDAEVFEYHGAIFELVKGLSEQNINNEKWKYINDNLDKLMINNIIVLPADLRPASKMSDSKNDYSHVIDKINRRYRKLLIKNEKMANTHVDIRNFSRKIYFDYFRQIQKVVNELYDFVLESLSTKDGLIRGHILGKRIDFSGRAVIVPDPTLNLDECKLPYFMFLELFKIYIAKSLIEVGYYKFLNMAIQHVNSCISSKSYNLFDFCQVMLEKNQYVCILNRQPSLHRLGMLGFKIKLENPIHYIKDINGNLIENDDPEIKESYKWVYTHSNVIKIHPLVCPCFNADFDGDQMAVYIPISKKSSDEIIDKFLSTKNLSNPANSELTTLPSQDIVLGIYTLTSDKFPKLKDEIVFKGKSISKSKSIFNKCLPDDYPIINYVVAKKELINILNDIKDHYDENITSKVLDNIKQIGFEYATLFGATISLDQCELKDKSLKNEIYSGEIYQQLSKISSNETEEYLRQNFGYSYIVDSGSRGTWDQVRQIILSRGFISNFQGDIISTPVKSSLLDGLTPIEFFNSTYGCRKGLLDIAINTGVSGYLSRKLVFTCANLQKDLELDDCGTTDCLTVHVDSNKKSEMLIYRYYLNDNNELVEITKENNRELIGKTIQIRSPIFCKSYNICHKCYGNLWKFLNTRFIGIIAAQSLGERSTQLTLRTFHTSLHENTKILDINNKSYTIEDVYNRIKTGESLYTFSCSPDGKIEVSKIIDAHKDRFENKMIRITLDNNEIIECTLDHEFIMKDGSHKKAENLNVDDSLMPIYFGDNRDGYRTIKQNYKSKFHRDNKCEKIYKLTSNHYDVKRHELLNENLKIYRHHIDKNRKNDYPNNIMLLNAKQHLSFHYIDAINSPNRINSRIAVSESNKRRTKNPEFIKKFNERRNETIRRNESYKSAGIKIKQFYKDNPEVKDNNIKQARLIPIKIIIEKIKERNLELTDKNYKLIRNEFFNNGKKYPTFKYAIKTYPKLFNNFSIIENDIDINDNHRVIKIEFVKLDKYEEFYDLTVDSKYHNFALESGIFIHNSGVATIKSDNNNMKQEDIISDLSNVDKLFHHFEGKDCNKIVKELFDIYSNNGRIHQIHFESVVSQLMWNGSEKWRLIENRDEIKPEFYSIQKVPSYESWILGLGFGDPKRHILKGLLSKGNYYGILDKILLGKKL